MGVDCMCSAAQTHSNLAALTLWPAHACTFSMAGAHSYTMSGVYYNGSLLLKQWTPAISCISNAGQYKVPRPSPAPILGLSPLFDC